MIESEFQVCERINKHLGLDSTPDARLKVKADIMKDVIYYGCIWKEGIYSVWINRMSIRCKVSTRKIREDYIAPLIDEGIFKLNGGTIAFVGIEKPSKEDDIVEVLTERYIRVGMVPPSREEILKDPEKCLDDIKKYVEGKHK